MRHFIGDRPVHLISVVVFMALPSIAFSQMNFTLEMPDNYFVTGSPCGLDLHIQNSGPAYPDVDLYVLLDVGIGGYWFYPGWGYYPPQADWEDTSFAAPIDETRTIIPGFAWPQISGSFSGARFMAAAVVGTSLISNVSIFEFGWGSDIAVPDSVYIPPGDFMMGSYDEELCRFDGEDRHQVILSHGF